jgi:hypothetical protein
LLLGMMVVAFAFALLLDPRRANELLRPETLVDGKALLLLPLLLVTVVDINDAVERDAQCGCCGLRSEKIPFCE